MADARANEVIELLGLWRLVARLGRVC